MHGYGLGSWIAKRRLKTPDKVALIYGADTVITYRELADEVDRTAARLGERGIGKGDSVAFLGENSPDFLTSLFGCALIGAVFVPINTRLAPPEILHVLADSRARALIYDETFAQRVDPLVSAVGIQHTFEIDAASITAPSELPHSERARAGDAPRAEVLFADPALILYTSGTTGRAKGAVLTHENLTWAAINCIVDYDVVSTDVALMISPLFHAASLGMGALPVLMKGGTIVLERGFHPGRALDLIQRHGVTMLSGVPTTFQLLADHDDWDTTDISTLQKLTCGGSAVPTRVVSAYEQRGLTFSQGYGMTEASPGVTSLPPKTTPARQGSVGHPHFFTDVRITDERGSVVPPGVVGEIEIAGPNVFSGYRGLPAETAAAFTDDGWFRSGDLGLLDDDGYLFIADRLKDLIISGGENIYPAEIENLLYDIDGVIGAAVVGVPDEQWGEVPWAIITVREGVVIDTDAVRSHLDGRLARYKLPKNVVIADALPRTASGKVRKAELRARFGS